ncbi:hypothetical protein PO909_002158 [Leuciscus waleckii]
MREIEGARIDEATQIKVFRDGAKRESLTVVLSFQERALPERVFLGCLSFKVHPYRRPPLRCFKCQRYGHIAAACRGDRRCGKCGGEHEFSESKEKVVKCGSCGGGHIAGNRECEQYKQAMRVQQFRETNKGVSYAEAVKKIATCSKVSDSRRREEECPPSVAHVTEDSVVVEAGEVPLRLRRAKLALNYFVKIKSSGSALPSISLLAECWEFRKGESRLNRFSVLHSVKTYAEELKLNERKMVPSVCWPSIPHWLLPEADVDISIKILIKEGSVGNVAHYVQEHLRNLWNSYIDIYTDGSRDPESKKVGFGLYIPHFHVRQCHRLPDGLSIFTAELVAIIWALRWVEERGVEKAIICSDSLSGLMAVGGERGGARLDLVEEILTSVYRLERRGVVWVSCGFQHMWGLRGMRLLMRLLGQV